MGQPVVHFEIECRDGQGARRFYSELFDWTIKVIPDNPAEYGLVAQDDNGGGIGGAVCAVPQVPSSTFRGPSRDEGHAGQVTVFVQVPDVEKALMHAEKLGGRGSRGPACSSGSCGTRRAPRSVWSQDRLPSPPVDAL